MSIEWHFEDDDPTPDPSEPRGSRWWWPLVALLVGAVGLGMFWWWGAERVSTAVSPTQIALQQLLDTTAVSLFTPEGSPAIPTRDPAWRVAQWQPVNRVFWQAQPTLTSVSQPDPASPDYWLNVGWTGADGQPRQRLLLATQIGEQFYWLGDDPVFWGDTFRAEYSWGALRFRERDEDLHTAVANFIASQCAAQTCPLLTITLATDYAPSPDPREIHLPSPRLIALTADGQPAPEFFDQLAAQIAAFAQPTPLRFAVPDAQVRVFTELARRYSEQPVAPPVPVEIISLADLPPDPADWLPLVDGALFSPTPALLMAGHMLDLTPFLSATQGFDAADFYEQIWQGGEWQERLWLLPHTAVAPFLYYDPAAYLASNQPEPSQRPHWNWARLQQDAQLFYEEPAWAWGLVTTEPEMLAYGYAFTQLPDAPRAYLPAGQAFLSELAAVMPDVSVLSASEREIFFYGQVASSTRRTPLWLDTPQNFEHHQQSRQARVAPWPGVVPLRVTGGVISQQSARPTAVWSWLTYLSRQYPERTSRHIPARPSVAREVFFWQGLPQPLRHIMLEGFAEARAIRLDE